MKSTYPGNRNGWMVYALVILFASCVGKKQKDFFEVSGKVTNPPAQIIYLDEIPVANMQKIVVDSARIEKDGSYVLKTESREACVYNLRVSPSGYPLAALVNDAPKIKLDATFNKENNQFVESYTVQGSESSQQLKNYIYGFTDKLQNIYLSERRTDSLKKTNVADSTISRNQRETENAIEEIRAWTLSSMDKSNNPALTLFELGYYQSTANNSEFRLIALNNDEVNTIIGDLAIKFPAHKGIAAIKKSLEAEMNLMKGWVGQPAPDLVLPDVDGKEVKLSSFKGKYVLVDFWASWCPPCRRENPHIVRTYEKFKNKNFDILGVSLDRPGQKEEWLQAIKEDNLSWTQVSDLLYWDSPVVSLYRINGLPYNILVDPDGIVVAEQLHGPELERKLSELVK